MENVDEGHIENLELLGIAETTEEGAKRKGQEIVDSLEPKIPKI